jgi:hypothetical protein
LAAIRQRDPAHSQLQFKRDRESNDGRASSKFSQGAGLDRVCPRRADSGRAIIEGGGVLRERSEGANVIIWSSHDHSDESPLRWTTKSAHNLADELTRQGHRVGAGTVGDLLRGEGFSLQGNAKTLEGQRHPDRDAQFRYISEQVKAHQETADPVVSVDAKKKDCDALSHVVSECVEGGWLMPGT